MLVQDIWRATTTAHKLVKCKAHSSWRYATHSTWGSASVHPNSIVNFCLVNDSFLVNGLLRCKSPAVHISFLTPSPGVSNARAHAHTHTHTPRLARRGKTSTQKFFWPNKARFGLPHFHALQPRKSSCVPLFLHPFPINEAHKLSTLV